MIDVKNLHKYFGSLEVLKGIDCHIDKGECVCVIGPSGSGKSTFLRAIWWTQTACSDRTITGIITRSHAV